MRFAVLLCAAALLASAADVRYYLVEGSMELPAGRPVGTTVSLVKRVVDRDAGRIDETVLSFRGAEPAKEFTTVITPGPDKALVTSPQGGVSGEAMLTGPEWAWTRMKFTTRLEPGGMRVEGDDEFSPDSISARKEIYSPEGKLQLRIDESGRSISKQLYEALRARLMVK